LQVVLASTQVSIRVVIDTVNVVTKPTGSAVAAASDIHRQMPTHMADIRRDWLTNQNTD